MATRIQLRRDTATNWTTADPVLSQWEIWLETDTLKIKIGDWESLRSELTYFAGAWWATTFSQTTQTLTDGATVSWDASAGSCWILTLGWDRALANMTNAIAWRTYTLIVKQDGTAPRLLTFGNQYMFPWSTEPVLSSTNNAVDILQFLAESSTVFHLVNFISDSKA